MRHVSKAIRDWQEAVGKVHDEATCRICGHSSALDPAHLWPRSLGGDEDRDNIVPLCRTHHRAFDHGEFDLGPYLTLSEKIKVVELAEVNGRRDGLNAAHERLFPSAHPRKVAA